MESFIRYILVIGVGCSWLLATTNAVGWGSTGHMITAQIAVDRLDQTTRAEVERLVDLLSGFDPKLGDIVPAATWMDEIKGFDHGLLAFNDWHYYDQPYNPHGLAGASAPSPQNVVWAIGQAAATIGSPRSTDFEKALMLRMLIHFVGDVHQPLHDINRLSAEHPSGDYGGNLFALSGSDAKELHAFWDDTAGLFPGIDPLKDWSEIVDFAASIEKEVPISTQPPMSLPGTMSMGEWASSNAQVWANESYHHGVNTAYVGIQEHTAPSPAYTANAQGVIKERLALGGYRLAAILNEVIKSGTEKPPEK